MRHSVTSTILAAGVAVSGILGLGALNGPAEDSPGFDTRHHGNHIAAVYLDPRPNDGKAQRVKYLLNFDTGEFKDARHWIAPMHAGDPFIRRCSR